MRLDSVASRRPGAFAARHEKDRRVKTHARTVSAIATAAKAVLAGLCLFGATGCGGFFYAIYSSGATSKIETAQQLGAEKYAAYEYYYAREHLVKAMEEASSANYGDAIDLAEAAEKAADKAILLSKQGHEGSGR
jgi:hypothetical protein